MLQEARLSMQPNSLAFLAERECQDPRNGCCNMAGTSHHNTVKENHFSTKRYCQFWQEGTAEVQKWLLQRCSAPRCMLAVEEAQFTVHSKQQISVSPSAVMLLSSHYLADATATH